MRAILEHCSGGDARQFPTGALLLSEGKTSGQLFVLIEGEAEVLRGDVPIARVSDPGAVFGEMSILLGLPHTATVRAASPVRAYVFQDAEGLLRSNPEIGLHLAKLLAQRLNAATTYLVDLKRQFEDRRDHLGMVGEVLESLMYQQDEAFTSMPERQFDSRL